WYYDTGNDHTLTFPDPRTLYQSISAAARFDIVGTSYVNGVEVTHLRAQNPSAIPIQSLASVKIGPLSSFDMWVDPADVVQQLAFASDQTIDACNVGPSSGPGSADNTT